MSKELQQAATWATNWMKNESLPAWWNLGADKKNGGWYEQLNQDGSPVQTDRRFRTQARQLYVYAEAQEHELFENSKPVEHGLKTLLPLYKSGQGFPKLLTPEGKVKDDSFSFYDNVFGLLGLGGAYRIGGEAKLEKTAQELIQFIEKTLASTAAANPGGPLQMDPFMHMFETCMYWGDITGDDFWLNRASTVAKQAMKIFFDRKNSILHEYFNSPAEDSVRPGHHFEWAWLLDHWQEMSDDDFSDISEKLYVYAEAKGIDAARGVAVDELGLDGSVKQASARQWPQTERLRAALSRWAQFDRPKDLANGLTAFNAMKKYLDVPTKGLWHDTMQADGIFKVGPAWASSFYHYLGAVVELRTAATLAE